MAIEIEHKFLLKSDAWRAGAKGTEYRQGYLCSAPERTVRVRVAGGAGTLTIKGASRGASRPEFEYSIPLDDARHLLEQLCERPLIEKTRYRIPFGGLTWEVDEFAGENAGLIVAEVELTDEAQHFERPDWVGEDVTSDPRYSNSALCRRPFRTW